MGTKKLTFGDFPVGQLFTIWNGQVLAMVVDGNELKEWHGDTVPWVVMSTTFAKSYTAGKVYRSKPKGLEHLFAEVLS